MRNNVRAWLNNAHSIWNKAPPGADGVRSRGDASSGRCGRRNDALKLWTAWQRLGDEGWSARVDRQMELAQYAAKRIRQHPDLELCEEPPFVTVCFTVPGCSSAQICEKLHVDGLAMIGHGDFREQQSIRLVTMNPNVTNDEIDALLDNVVQAASAVAGLSESLPG